jgi:hypothetical protein
LSKRFLHHVEFEELGVVDRPNSQGDQGRFAVGCAADFAEATVGVKRTSAGVSIKGVEANRVCRPGAGLFHRSVER